MLVLEFDLGICDEAHDGLIVNQDRAQMGSARYRLSHALIDDLGREVFCPAVGAEPVPTLDARHHL